MAEKIDELIRELEDVKEENDLLLQQLHQVQEELEHYYLLYTSNGSVEDRSFPDNEVNNERRERKKAEKKRDEILTSTSWRISAPLRWARSRLTGQKMNVIEPSPSEFCSFAEEYEARLRAKKQIDALLTSTSWRMTAPIRWRPLAKKRLKQQLSDLEQRLGSVYTERDGLKQQLNSARTQCNGLEQQLNSARAQRNGLEQQLESARAQCNELEHALATTIAERDELKKAVSDVTKQRDDAKQQLEHIRNVNTEQQNRQEVLDEELTKVEAQVDLIKDLLQNDADL